jgi:hypothetical protein
MKMSSHARRRLIAVCGVLALSALARPVFALQQGNETADGRGLTGTLFLVFLLVVYIYVALCVQTIAKKTNTPQDWLAWIPIANIILMLSIAKKPFWWIILWLIPIVNIVIAVIVWRAIAKARYKPEWWGTLVIVPLAGLLVVAGYLAFSGDRALDAPETPQVAEGFGVIDAGQGGRLCAGASWLYCVSGEFARELVEIPATGFYIGRDPSKANLVLGSHEISSVHVRVWPQPGVSQVWVEDWNSLNGTYYRPDGQGSPSEWVLLKGKVLLSRGARFRLSDNIAEFEIRAA